MPAWIWIERTWISLDTYNKIYTQPKQSGVPLWSHNPHPCRIVDFKLHKSSLIGVPWRIFRKHKTHASSKVSVQISDLFSRQRHPSNRYHVIKENPTRRGCQNWNTSQRFIRGGSLKAGESLVYLAHCCSAHNNLLGLKWEVLKTVLQ